MSLTPRASLTTHIVEGPDYRDPEAGTLSRTVYIDGTAHTFIVRAGEPFRDDPDGDIGEAEWQATYDLSTAVAQYLSTSGQDRQGG